MARMNPDATGGRSSEQAQVAWRDAAQVVVVDHDDPKASGLGQHPGLGFDDLGNEHPADRPERGVEVIKIEDTGPGDYARAMGPGERATVGKGGDSVFFRMVNRNKKSLRLDLKQAAGVAALRGAAIAPRPTEMLSTAPSRRACRPAE